MESELKSCTKRPQFRSASKRSKENHDADIAGRFARAGLASIDLNPRRPTTIRIAIKTTTAKNRHLASGLLVVQLGNFSAK
jgi:hypothetical protein